MARTHKQQKKRTMRERHAGRLELRGRTFIARWMLNGKRFTQSTGIKIDGFDGDERRAREAAETWLARKLATVKAADAVRRTDADEASIRAAQEIVFKGALQQLDERRREAADTVPPLRIDEAFDRMVKSADYKTPTPQTIRASRMRFDRFRRWMAANHATVVEMREVTPMIAKEYAEELKAGIGAATYNVHLVTLNQVWTVLADEIKAQSNPWAKVRKQTAEKSYRRAFTDAELEAVFNAAAGDDELTMLFSIMVFTGARLSDACLMRWESISFTRGVLDFVAVKTGARCKPPILPALRQLLERTPQDQRTGYIVPRFAAAYKTSPRNPSNEVTELVKRAGLATSTIVNGRAHPVLTAHAFRHTFISRCGNQGVPLAIVQGWVGHMDAGMTNEYFHEDTRASLAYANALLHAHAPKALENAAKDAPAVECVIVPTDGADAREARWRAFCDAIACMDADELARAAGEIERRREN